MLSQRSLGWIIWSAVVLSASSLFFFRCFLSLDGPMHVLHAGALGNAFLDRAASSGVLSYDLSGLDDCLLDPIAYLLLMWFRPEVVETCLGAGALFACAGGAVSYGHALIGEHRWGTLLVVPLSVSYLLVLGFFPFLFSVGLCFWLMGRWVRLVRITGRSLLLGSVAVAACLLLHRGALPLLGFLLLVHEATAMFTDPAASRTRWSTAPRWLPGALVAAGVVVLTAFALHLFYLRPVYELAPSREAFDLLRLRPWLLVHHDAEVGMRSFLGVLLLGAIGFAVRRSLRTRPSGFVLAPLLCGAGLILGSLFIDTPWTALHYVPERAQLVGVTLVVSWAVAMRPNTRWMMGFALLALLLHGYRLMYLEKRLANYEAARASAAQVVRHLVPGALVAAERTTDDWLLGHGIAQVMARYSGVVVSRHDKLPISTGTLEGDQLSKKLRARRGAMRWITDCVDDPACPAPHHVLLLGTDPAAWLALYPQVADDLHRDYAITASTGHWMVWTRKPAK